MAHRIVLSRQTEQEPRVILSLQPGDAYEEVQLRIDSYLETPCVLFPQRLRWTLTPPKGRERDFAVEIKGGMPERIEMPPRAQTPASRSLIVRLNYQGLTAGLYRLRVHPAPDAVLRDHRPVKIQDALLSFYLPNPVQPPKAEVGQTFLCLPDSERLAFPYRDERDQPLDWRKVALRLWRLTQVKPDELEFAIEGLSGRARCVWEGDIVQLPSLLPIVEEPTVRKLRARYEGKHVWGYGGIGAIALLPDRNAFASFGFERLKPARVLLLRRVWKPWVSLALGSTAGYIGERMYRVLTHHPLFVRLLPEGRAYTGFGSFPGHSPFEKGMDNPRRYALGFYAWHADEWDFERAYSLQSPLELSKRWEARERRALRTGELAKGLRHEVVAWIWGWPSLYGTKQELMRLSQWIYEDVPPFEATLTFRNGRLVSWHIPRLP